MSDLNNLGSFSNINGVWAKYPEGGKEGDYLTIGGIKYRWNKYDRIWENAATVTESPARETKTIDGDLIVNNNATVGGNLNVRGILKANKVKQPNCGLFETLAKLKESYPNPSVGMWAAVGNNIPAPIYRCDIDGQWTATGESGGADALDLSKYDQGVQAANEALAKANNLEAKVNAPNGLAPLDENKKVPAANLPSYIDDVVEFSSMLDTATITASATVKSSKDEGCSVCYVSSIQKFVLAVTEDDGTITYYNDWADRDIYESADLIPLSGKVFLCISTNQSYRWSGTQLSVIKSDITIGETPNSAFAGSRGVVLEMQAKAALFVNANILLGIESTTSLAVVRTMIDNRNDSDFYMQRGVVITFKSENGWESWQWQHGEWDEENGWRKFGGSASVGNCYNVTYDEPLQMGYYSLDTAIAKAFEKGYTTIGIQITFAIGDKSWKTYQYVGSDSSESNFKDTNNWLDLAGMSAGAETLINVDSLCGPFTETSFYTLEYAVAAILSLQKSTGIKYVKSGLVITYKVGENKWETKQFKGSESDFGEIGLWQDFGSAGTASEIKTKDEPEDEGKDAFSTGGAYKHIPANLHIDAEEKGVVKISMKNSSGETIGDEQQFAVGTGSGEASGTIVTFTPEKSPFYAKAGGSVILKAAVRSFTTIGGQEQLNMIERVELYDRDTNQLLETFRLNKASSADNETFDFSFDLSSYFSIASGRKFRFMVYDDSDHSGSRNVNVTAVDVTVRSEQTLNYTSSTAIIEGGSIKSLPMYRFPNNSSDKGILCLVEIFISDEWKTLGSATITDTYSHSISINPLNCAGNILTHGAYPLRIHGEDIASGVVGNYLHTSVMVVNSENSTPIVANRWYSEKRDGEVRQYETISMDFAAYHPTQSKVDVSIVEISGDNVAVKRTASANRNETYTYSHRVGEVKTDGSVTISLAAKVGNIISRTADFIVIGTLLDIESVTAQLMVDIDMSGRSNSDTDKDITSNGYTLRIIGSNYTTNGFVKDSFGTPEYGTDGDKGLMALRIAENISAQLDYTPFNQAAIEVNGMAVQWRMRTRHIADDDARVISCISNGIGFYATGKNVVFTTDNGATVAKTITAALKEDSITDVAIVIEPASMAPYSGIGVVKMYFDGELIGACYYDRGTLSRHASQISFDGSKCDLYLYNIRAWETYYSFEQSFNNYLLELSDTDLMIQEHGFNQVMASQTAEGKPAVSRPQAAALYNIGIPYFVVCKNSDTSDTSDNYPDYLEGLDGDKKTTRILDVYAYFPERPYQDFKAIGVTISNQGTTSSQRPIKNIKMKLKTATITLLRSREEFTGDDLAKYDECAANASNHRVQIIDTSLPTNIITVKVDYSESGGANNGASTQLYNELQRALGEKFMTPAQNAYTGKYVLNTSIDSIPCAFFRTDEHSSDATSPSYGYFHAKGNWNDDKGDAAVFGFEKADGYNDSCLNYGEFIELIAARNQSLDDFNTSIDKSLWDTDEIYVLSEFCGPAHKIFRFQDGEWTETTGSMTYTGGRWRITGDVVNPVENYELLVYNGLCWFQGVKSVDDMLAPDSKGIPTWLTYFESRYPDDDNLNTAYEDGRKVPYQLFRWLEWCEQCNHNLGADAGDITIDGSVVPGTKENRLVKFKRELHKMANVHSVVGYHIFTDYIAAVDQRAKNMMVGFYLDTDGETRMYLNHLYDGDTILGSDNDCGLTIPAELDPNNDPDGYYQGHDSILFTQIAASDYIWLTDYENDNDIADTTRTTTVADIASMMRSIQLPSGLLPFSPQGIEKYWITDRLKKWPKLVSSFDGIRKYIEHSKDSANYLYALHGLSIQRLQDYVATRFRYRDGFYQCGDTFTSAVKMRCTGTQMSITIKAAKAGFFGIGVDRANEARESAYLKEGESVTLHSNNTNTGSGVMLYIFGADRIGELDIRNATPKQSGWDISELTLLKRFIIGGEDYRPATETGEELSTLNLGQLPFLEELDVRNFPITSIDATYCPRLTKLLAGGSTLQSFTPAQTSPISVLDLPETMTNLSFVNLPNLVYPNGGLTFNGFSSVTRLQVAGCAGINQLKLLQDVMRDGAELKEISITGIDTEADTTILDSLMESGVQGIGSDLEYGCDGLSGTWLLSTLIDEEDLLELQEYFPELTIHNSQFTTIMFDDTINDPMNIVNMENGTTGSTYKPSGHILLIRAGLVPVKGKVNPTTGVFEAERISESDYKKLPNGDDFDYSDILGNSFDVFMRCPECWYKGINDFKNQKKYICFSKIKDEPLSTAKRIIRKRLRDIILHTNTAITTTGIDIGSATLETEGIMTSTPSYNAYQIDVDGMKQVRWPGLNSSSIGSVFLDENGVIISSYNMAISNSMFDFSLGDYIFIDVPKGAKTFVFTSAAANNDLEAIAVDSSNVEAIEPDWILNPEWLGGVYQASVDGLMQLRSISGAMVRTGTGKAETSIEWLYDENGKPTNTPVNPLNYTGQDFSNLAARRGEGYQLFDYEMSKFMAILWYAMNGTRDAQLKCGYGKGPGGTTGYSDLIGNADSTIGQFTGNKCLGFESFFGCTWEFMDNVGINIITYEQWLREKRAQNITTHPLDTIWHIYDPINKTERTVQGITTSGYCIGRVKHGRFCDIIASVCITDNSVWAANYCDGNYYSHSKGRVVGRSASHAGAYGGLACANASYASSDSNTGFGARLAFRGKIKLIA